MVELCCWRLVCWQLVVCCLLGVVGSVLIGVCCLSWSVSCVPFLALRVCFVSALLTFGVVRCFLFVVRGLLSFAE